MLKKFPNTEATVQYLKIIEYTLKAYNDEDTYNIDRVFYATYIIQFLRTWRQWLYENNFGSNNFITSNTWEGLEINLIFLLDLTLTKNAQNIHKMNSQANEKFFRKTRSFTGVESTIVNSSMYSFSNRLHTMIFEEEIVEKLHHQFKFPKFEKKENSEIPRYIPLEKPLITQIVQRAVEAANRDAETLGLDCETEFDCAQWFQTEDEPSFNETFLNDDVGEAEEQSNERNIFRVDDDDYDFESESENEQVEELTIENLSFVNENSFDSFLYLTSGQKILKKCFIWNIQNDKIDISTDKRRRFIPKKAITISSNAQSSNPIWKADHLSKGDYVLIESENKNYFGCVINFKYLNEKFKSNFTYHYDYIKIAGNNAGTSKKSNKKEVGFMIDPAFEIKNGNKIEKSLLEVYFSLKTYKSHCNQNINFSNINLRNLNL